MIFHGIRPDVREVWNRTGKPVVIGDILRLSESRKSAVKLRRHDRVDGRALESVGNGGKFKCVVDLTNGFGYLET